MGYPVKQSTTTYELLFFMVDTSDHIAGKTGLTPTVTIRKAAGSFASPSGAVSEIANGWYKVAGNATDSNTLGPLLLHASSAGADPFDDEFFVVAYDPQDSVRLGLTALPNAAAEAAGGLLTRGSGAGQINQNANGQVDVRVVGYSSGNTPLQPTTAGRTLDVSATGEAGIDLANVGSPTTTLNLSGTTVNTTTNLTNAPPDSSGVTTLLSRIPAALFSGITSLANWLGALAGKQTANSTAITEIRATGAGSGTFDATTDSQEALRDNMGTAQTGDAYARLGAPAGASVSADIAALPNASADALLDRSNGIETSITLRQALRLVLAAEAGKLSGAGTTTIVIRNAGDSKNRITATVDADGNRTTVTYDLT